MLCPNFMGGNVSKGGQVAWIPMKRVETLEENKSFAIKKSMIRCPK
jgi:hypothetical protein